MLAAEQYKKPNLVNIGTGREISIRDLVGMIQKYTGFHGEIRWETNKPDGQPRRCLVTSHANEELGFEAKVMFDEGLKRTIEWYQAT